jgi:hypothetical protein
MECPECKILRRQNAALIAKIHQLRMLLQEAGGEPPNLYDDPYEDEQPLVPWGSDR